MKEISIQNSNSSTIEPGKFKGTRIEMNQTICLCLAGLNYSSCSTTPPQPGRGIGKGRRSRAWTEKRSVPAKPGHDSTQTLPRESYILSKSLNPKDFPFKNLTVLIQSPNFEIVSHSTWWPWTSKWHFYGKHHGQNMQHTQLHISVTSQHPKGVFLKSFSKDILNLFFLYWKRRVGRVRQAGILLFLSSSSPGRAGFGSRQDS